MYLCISAARICDACCEIVVFFLFTFKLTRGDFHSDLHPDQYLCLGRAHAMHILFPTECTTYVLICGKNVYSITLYINNMLPIMHYCHWWTAFISHTHAANTANTAIERIRETRLMKMMPQNVVEINIFVMLDYWHKYVNRIKSNGEK